jgi:hypothetical protein
LRYVDVEPPDHKQEHFRLHILKRDLILLRFLEIVLEAAFEECGFPNQNALVNSEDLTFRPDINLDYR